MSATGFGEIERLSTKGSYQAPHLNSLDLDAIVGEFSVFKGVEIPTEICLVSTSSGDMIKAESTRNFVYQVVKDITMHPVDWLALNNTILSMTRQSDIVLLAFGPMNKAELQNLFPSPNSRLVVTLAHDELFSERSLQHNNPNAIAIVSMAGRFPGSEDLEQFWNILRDGRELCKQVCVSQKMMRLVNS